MRSLPSGTVTMLFTDIEGSTLLLNRLGARFLDVLEIHRRVLREAWDAHGGTEMGTEGDSFFVVFTTAKAAVEAAVQGQRRLDAHAWPDGERLKVRMGMHTGTPNVHDGDYWGMDVHRAARIAASAHGGQVVVSGTTADLVRQDLPEGVDLTDLGMHHLKDLPSAEHIYQLDIDGLETRFAPLKTLGSTSNLPHPVTALLGRDRELDEVAALVHTPGARVVTLTGPGGAGKTRLAIAVAERLVPDFPGGVFFASLAAVTSAEVMWTSVAEAVEAPARERTPDKLVRWLGDRRLLLVLDNLEQVEGAEEVVDRLVEAAPGAVVVATSRRPLGLISEQRHLVEPLALPKSHTLRAALQSPAVQLFVARARAVNPRFVLDQGNVSDVVEICRRLDGLPLAVELCASRARVLGPRALLARLDAALDATLDIATTSTQMPARQRTMRATVAWSYDLLSPRQRWVLRHLGVFAGGAELDAVAAVAAHRAPSSTPPDGDLTVGTPDDLLEVVADLSDANLVQVSETPDGEPRVTLLETIRAFALDELAAAGGLDAARDAHAVHYADLARRLSVLRESRHLLALSTAETELDNFRAALSWTVGDEGAVTSARDSGTALRLCAGLSWFWVMGGYVVEGRRWYERIVASADGRPSAELAGCLAGLGSILLAQGEPARASEAATRALAMAREVDSADSIAFALGVLGTAQLVLGDLAVAKETLEESLVAHRRCTDTGRLARALGNLAGIEENLGHVERSEELLLESIRLLDELGDLHELGIQRQNLANLLVVSGRLDEADRLVRDLLETILALRSPSLTMAYANTVMNLVLRQGHPVEAARLFGAEEAMHERFAMPNPWRDEEYAEAVEAVAGTLTREDFDAHRLLARHERLEELLVEVLNGTAAASDRPLETLATPRSSGLF
jgi:predicted ATPase/class 3 adenylate cyclase